MKENRYNSQVLFDKLWLPMYRKTLHHWVLMVYLALLQQTLPLKYLLRVFPQQNLPLNCLSRVIASSGGKHTLKCKSWFVFQYFDCFLGWWFRTRWKWSMCMARRCIAHLWYLSSIFWFCLFAFILMRNASFNFNDSHNLYLSKSWSSLSIVQDIKTYQNFKPL